MFAELLSTYGFDLQKWFNSGREGYSVKHVWCLIDALPPSSFTQSHRYRAVESAKVNHELSGEEKRLLDRIGWSEESKILAMIHNHIKAVTWRPPEGSNKRPTPDELGWIGPHSWMDAWKSGSSNGAGGPVKGETVAEAMSRLMGGR